VPERPEEWLADRRDRPGARLKEHGKTARAGTIPGGVIENGELRIEKLEAAAPDGVEQLVLDLYGSLPRTRITDLLLEWTLQVCMLPPPSARQGARRWEGRQHQNRGFMLSVSPASEQPARLGYRGNAI